MRRDDEKEMKRAVRGFCQKKDIVKKKRDKTLLVVEHASFLSVFASRFFFFPARRPLVTQLLLRRDYASDVWEKKKWRRCAFCFLV